MTDILEINGVRQTRQIVQGGKQADKVNDPLFTDCSEYIALSHKYDDLSELAVDYEIRYSGLSFEAIYTKMQHELEVMA